MCEDHVCEWVCSYGGRAWKWLRCVLVPQVTPGPHAVRGIVVLLADLAGPVENVAWFQHFSLKFNLIFCHFWNFHFCDCGFHPLGTFQAFQKWHTLHHNLVQCYSIAEGRQKATTLQSSSPIYAVDKNPSQMKKERQRKRSNWISRANVQRSDLLQQTPKHVIGSQSSHPEIRWTVQPRLTVKTPF